MCKNLLMLREDRGVMMGICNCGFRRTSGIAIASEEKQKMGNNSVEVLDEKGFEKDGFFRICEKCGHDKAEADSIASNESDITIFSCLKCGHKVRQSQGSSKA
jgi:Zn ribbon nucleic-acid-binding protein